MSTFNNIQSSSPVARDTSNHPAVRSLPLEHTSVGDSGRTVNVPSSPSPFRHAADSLVRGTPRREPPDSNPIRVLTSMDSNASFSECTDTRNRAYLMPLRSPLEPFARFYIFDWDNTLCPTDWLCELYYSCGQSVYTAKRPCPALCSPVIRSRLAVLESSVRRLLQKCTERGQVTILSNATSIGLLKTLKLLPLIQRTLTELSEPSVCMPSLTGLNRRTRCISRQPQFYTFLTSKHKSFQLATDFSQLQKFRLFRLAICVSHGASHWKSGRTLPSFDW